MNDMQKRAWANLIVWLFFLAMVIIVFVLTAEDFDMRITLYVVAFLGLVVSIGVAPVLCQKYLPELFHRIQQGFEIAECGFRFWKKIEFDERDRAIKDRANLAGYIAAYSWYFGACLIAFFWDSISGSKLLLILVGGLGTHLFTRSLALLILYGWGGKQR
jgi:hypothetical protein